MWYVGDGFIKVSRVSYDRRDELGTLYVVGGVVHMLWDTSDLSLCGVAAKFNKHVL